MADHYALIASQFPKALIDCLANYFRAIARKVWAYWYTDGLPVL